MARAYNYATYADIEAHISQFTVTASSRPNASQADRYITDVSDRLDSKLATLDYSVPVATGATQAFDLVNSWTAVGAAMFCAAALPHGSDGKHLEFLERQWTAILTDLDQGNVRLPGVAKDSTTSLPRYASVPTGGSAYFTRDFSV